MHNSKLIEAGALLQAGEVPAPTTLGIGSRREINRGPSGVRINEDAHFDDGLSPFSRREKDENAAKWG